MNYISIGIIMLIAFVISVILTKLEIPVLKRRRDRTSERKVRNRICQRRGRQAWAGSR